MSTFGEVRNELERLKGKPASGITHGLKVWDGGENLPLFDNIINVLDKLNENYQREMMKTIKGNRTVCLAVSGTALIGMTYFWLRNREMKKQSEANQALIKDLKNEIKVNYCVERKAPIVTDSDNSDNQERHDCVIAEYEKSNHVD